VNFSAPVVIENQDNSFNSSSDTSFSQSNDRPVHLQFRAMLKRTEIDPEKSRVHLTGNETEKPVFDFRKMLRKTGRLELISAQNVWNISDV